MAGKRFTEWTLLISQETQTSQVLTLSFTHLNRWRTLNLSLMHTDLPNAGLYDPTQEPVSLY